MEEVVESLHYLLIFNLLLEYKLFHKRGICELESNLK